MPAALVTNIPVDSAGPTYGIALTAIDGSICPTPPATSPTNSMTPLGLYHASNSSFHSSNGLVVSCSSAHSSAPNKSAIPPATKSQIPSRPRSAPVPAFPSVYPTPPKNPPLFCGFSCCAGSCVCALYCAISAPCVGEALLLTALSLLFIAFWRACDNVIIGIFSPFLFTREI